MRVSVVQVAYGDGESVIERTERVTALVRAQAGHDLVVLPELWSAGGFAYPAWPSREQQLDGPVVSAVASAARDIRAVVHAGSVIEAPPGEAGPEGRGRWNTSVLLGPDGSLLASYRKVHRFGFGNGEPRLLEAGTDVVVVEVDGLTPEVAGEPARPGTPYRLGLSTCYDLRFPELYRAQVDRGAELFVVTAAWPAARSEHWRVLLRARAIENQCFVVACNTAGTHAGHAMGGYSAVVDPRGEVLAEAGPREQTVLSVEIDLDLVSTVREQFPVLADRRL